MVEEQKSAEGSVVSEPVYESCAGDTSVDRAYISTI